MDRPSSIPRLGELSIHAGLSLIGQMLAGYKPHPDDPGPFGPRRIRGPQPEPWHGDDIAWLNPQPLPPRWVVAASFADRLIAHLQVLPDADAARRELMLYADELCPPPFKWPFPWPKWMMKRPYGLDLVVIGGRFEAAAADASNAHFGAELKEVGHRVVLAGLAELG